MKTPQPRATTRGVVWLENETWLEPEEFTYPSGGFKRRAFVVLRQNEHNPVNLPYGEKRVVSASIPDTAFSISARLRLKGKTIRGFISTSDDNVFTFTPEADSANCVVCEAGNGCKR